MVVKIAQEPLRMGERFTGLIDHFKFLRVFFPEGVPIRFRFPVIDGKKAPGILYVFQQFGAEVAVPLLKKSHPDAFRTIVMKEVFSFMIVNNVFPNVSEQYLAPYFLSSARRQIALYKTFLCSYIQIKSKPGV